MPPMFVALLAIWFGFPQAYAVRDLQALLDDISAAYAKLEPQTIRPAEGYIKYDYLIPAGFYKQMWDWDGFFIGSHLAHQSRDQAKYLKWWVLSFAGASDRAGYVPGVITTQGPPDPRLHAVLGKFAVKPFLAQGAVIASEQLGDYQWVAPVWENLRLIIAYREKTQYDSKWGCFSGKPPCNREKTIMLPLPMTLVIAMPSLPPTFALSNFASTRRWRVWRRCWARRPKPANTSRKPTSCGPRC